MGWSGTLERNKKYKQDLIKDISWKVIKQKIEKELGI